MFDTVSPASGFLAADQPAGTIPALIGLPIIVNLENHDIRAPILGMGSEVRSNAALGSAPSLVRFAPQSKCLAEFNKTPEGAEASMTLRPLPRGQSERQTLRF